MRQARNDLRAAESLRAGGFYSDACFHAQQAAEKALKAVRYQTEGAQSRGHFLGAGTSGLLRVVVEHDASFERLREDAGQLDQYYTATRYPDMLPGDVAPFEVYSEKQAEEAIEAAGRIVNESARVIESRG